MTEKDKKAWKLVKILHSDPKGYVLGQWKGMRAGFTELIKKMVPNDQLLETLTEIDGKWETLWDDLGISELMDLFVPVYADAYTEEEIDALLEMVEGPVYPLLKGRAEQIQADCNKVSDLWMTNHQEQIMGALNTMLMDIVPEELRSIMAELMPKSKKPEPDEDES